MEMPQLKADYIEKIEIQPEDVIPKSFLFKCVKYSLVTILIIMILIAIIAIIVAESFLEQTYLAVGVISLVGIILFLIGLISIMKEHVPSILIFAISLIFYLLIIMYSRIFDSAGWIILRTIILSMIIIGTIVFSIMIRDWRQMQISRLRQRAIKETQYAALAHGMPMAMPPHHTNPYIHNHQYEQILPVMPENHYSQIGPSTSRGVRANANANANIPIFTTSHYH